MEDIQSISVLDDFRSKLKKYISSMDVKIFFLTFAFVLVVHMYMFTNKFLNHDDMIGLLSNCNYALSSGRWFLKPIASITGYFSSSWLIGVVGAVYLSVMCVVATRLFRFKHTFSAALMSFAMVSFPTITATNTYMGTADAYYFALMLSVLAAYMIHKEKLWSMGIGVACLTLSMGCYQSYIAVTSAMLIVIVAIDIVDKRWDDKWYGIIITAAKYLACLVLALVCYFVVLKICLAVTGRELVSYKGMDNMGQISISQFISRAIVGYKEFFGFYRDNTTHTFHTFFTALSALATVLSGITVVWAIVKRKIYRKPMLLVLFAVVALVFPLAVDLAFIMVDVSQTVHLLMRFPSVILLVLPAMALDRIKFDCHISKKKVLKSCVSLLFVGLLAVQLIICAEFAVLANRAYFTMDMSYKQTETYATKLFTKIEMTEGFTKTTPVALVGYAKVDSNFKYVGIIGAATANDILNTYHDAKASMFKYCFGTDYYYASDAVVEAIKQTDKYQEMPVYPAEGSIETINGVIVVKLS